MRIIRRAQRTIQKPGSAAIKADATIVTATDKEVEAVMYQTLGNIHSTKFVGEEGTTAGDGKYTIMVDPLDGTRPFAIRLATSTVIVALTDPKGEVVMCVIGDAATGRIWFTQKDGQTMCKDTLDEDGDTFLETEVWKGQLGGKRQAVVFTDHSLGFARSERQIFTDEQVGRVLTGIPKVATMLMPGSNGMNFALVANGSEFAAGQITTAIGGAWDVAGVLLVLNAGGAARAFRMGEDRQLVEVNPLVIADVDIMVSGNSQETVDMLVEQVILPAAK